VFRTNGGCLEVFSVSVLYLQALNALEIAKRVIIRLGIPIIDDGVSASRLRAEADDSDLAKCCGINDRLSPLCKRLIAGPELADLF